VSASVDVVPADVARLSFVVSAPVKEVLVSEGDEVHAGDRLVVLDTPDLSYALTAAQEALKSAEADEYIQGQGRRKWDGTKFVWLSGPPQQRQLAHAKTLQAQASLDAAQAELAQATLTAPFDGTVAAINVSRGEVVQSGEIALVLANLDHLRVETTDLSEREIARVQSGQPALVSLKAFVDPLPGIVTTIQPMAGRSPDGDIIYRVTIELQQLPVGLLWGMTGDVMIDTSS
jgi:multidrug resistance efflux pump